MTEDHLKQEALGWLAEAGYAHLYGPDIAPDGSKTISKSYSPSACVRPSIA